MRKKIILFFCLLIALMPVSVHKNNNYYASADVNASAEIAMELLTGTVLEESNADAKLPMASTTKIMTAIIIVEDCNLDEVITVPDETVGVEGSSIYLKKNEEIDVRDLLYGLMLRSGNDSATALAIHHSGSVENFVKVMNERAKKIGAEKTNFKNPSGLPDNEHYTTARDLCEIARYSMQNDTFKEVVSTTNYKGKYRSYTNKNKMLYNYSGANGVKTGYTVKAGRCLVSSAERNGMDVVTVVLNCYDMYERSANILDRCFDTFNLVKIDNSRVFISDKVLCKIKNTGYFVSKKGEKLTFEVIPVKNLKRVIKGDFVGKINIYGQKGLLFSDNLFSIINI